MKLVIEKVFICLLIILMYYLLLLIPGITGSVRGFMLDIYFVFSILMTIGYTDRIFYKRISPEEFSKLMF